jgi:hypothetical protein
MDEVTVCQHRVENSTKFASFAHTQEAIANKLISRFHYAGRVQYVIRPVFETLLQYMLHRENAVIDSDGDEFIKNY